MTATRTAARSTGDDTTTPVLAARRSAQQLGNPLPSLSRAVQIGERLLSMATALPDTEPDPYAALRRLLQAGAGLTESTARLRRVATRTAAGVQQSAAVREAKAAPARWRATEGARPARSAATPSPSQPATAHSETTRPVAQVRRGSVPDTAVARSPAASPFAVASFSTQPQRAPLRTEPPASLAHRHDAATTLAPQAAAGHELLAQRRRRLRDGLERSVATLPAASSEVRTLATLAALLGSESEAPVRPHSSTSSAEAPQMNLAAASHAPTAPRPAVSAPTTVIAAEHLAAIPTGSTSTQAAPPAARPGNRAHAARATIANVAPVRRLLPPSSPQESCGDVPTDTLLEAAYRHGVDPT